jgi:hypothetical protein
LPPPPPPPVDPIPELAPDDLELELTPLPSLPDFQTDSNSFGVYRIYKSGKPTYTPDEGFTINSVADSPNFVVNKPDNASKWTSPFGIADPPTNSESESPTSHLPFKNMSVFRLMRWFYDASVTKSLQSLNSLVQGVLLAPGFSLEDLAGFDAAKEAKCLDDYQETNPVPGSGTNQKINDGWIETTIRKKVNYIHTAHNPKYVERIPCSARNGRESME